MKRSLYRLNSHHPVHHVAGHHPLEDPKDHQPGLLAIEPVHQVGHLVQPTLPSRAKAGAVLTVDKVDHTG